MIGRSGIRSLTIGDNLITLCTKCHKNVHHGHLKITGTAPHGLRFLNLLGNDIRQERTLEIAFWLDIWCGWKASHGDGHGRYFQARDSLSRSA